MGAWDDEPRTFGVEYDPRDLADARTDDFMTGSGCNPAATLYSAAFLELAAVGVRLSIARTGGRGR